MTPLHLSVDHQYLFTIKYLDANVCIIVNQVMGLMYHNLMTNDKHMYSKMAMDYTILDVYTQNQSISGFPIDF